MTWGKSRNSAEPHVHQQMAGRGWGPPPGALGRTAWAPSTPWTLPCCPQTSQTYGLVSTLSVHALGSFTHRSIFFILIQKNLCCVSRSPAHRLPIFMLIFCMLILYSITLLNLLVPVILSDLLRIFYIQAHYYLWVEITLIPTSQYACGSFPWLFPGAESPEKCQQRPPSLCSFLERREDI